MKNLIQKSGAISLCVALLSLNSLAESGIQKCKEKFVSVEDNKLGYQLKKSGVTYCEGMLKNIPVSREKLSIISLLKGRLYFDSDENEVVNLSLPISMTPETRRVQVQVLPIINKHYRLDSLMSNGEILNWKIGDVVYREKLESRQIGMLGWYVDEYNIKNYVPVRADWTISESINDDIFRVGFISLKHHNRVSSKLECPNEQNEFIEFKSSLVKDYITPGEILYVELSKKASGSCSISLFSGTNTPLGDYVLNLGDSASVE